MFSKKNKIIPINIPPSIQPIIETSKKSIEIIWIGQTFSSTNIYKLKIN